MTTHLDDVAQRRAELAAQLYSAQPAPEPADPYSDVPPPDEPDENTTGNPARSTRPPLRSQLLTVSELARLKPPTALVGELLFRGTLAQLSAAAGSYKSFAAVAIACAVALGHDLDDHRVPAAENVVYCAAEGASSLLPRILAWCELNGADPKDLDGRLFILPAPIQLGSALDVTEAQALARDINAGLVILDTRSKVTIGLDENSNTEQARAVAAAERIVEANQCAVLVIHHNGRSGTSPRGATAWDGGVWSDLRMEGADLIARIHCHKHKDAPSQCDHHFRLVAHTVSEDLMPGTSTAVRNTLVLVQNHGWTNAATQTGSDTRVLDLVWTTAPPEGGLTGPQIVDLAKEQGIAKSTVYGAVNRLVRAGKLKNTGTEKRARYVVSAAAVAELEQQS
ncbi:AAA family ATPase [Gordonia amicalis]|uniref:AAA family ATPase n=1 Tax=Gordonia amicalis TaxID=89053 RepID=UPI002955D523|nr:AAA family ATPase [Gordonia amicalis]MDV7099704.1 AAA family ATPase [Gordonia amicalis]